jgi:hypothetical protein
MCWEGTWVRAIAQSSVNLKWRKHSSKELQQYYDEKKKIITASAKSRLWLKNWYNIKQGISCNNAWNTLILKEEESTCNYQFCHSIYSLNSSLQLVCGFYNDCLTDISVLYYLKEILLLSTHFHITASSSKMSFSNGNDDEQNAHLKYKKIIGV